MESVPVVLDLTARAARRRLEAEQTEDLLLAEKLSSVDGDLVDVLIEEVLFVTEDARDPLFDRALADVAIDGDGILLPDPVRAILGLPLDSWVPPAVEVNDVGRTL